MAYDIIGVGNPLVDILIKGDEDFVKRHGLVKGGMRLVGREALEKILSEAGEKEMASGGSAANMLNALGILGVSCCLIGKIGSDKMGEFLKGHIKGNGVSSGLIAGDKETGRVISIISDDLERSFATYLGAAADIGEGDLKEDIFTDCKIVHIEGYLVLNRKLVRSICEIAKRKGAKISLDMASFNVVEQNQDFFEELIDKYVDIIFANEDEAMAFTGKEPAEALEEMASKVEIAVVKIGEKGSLVKKGNEVYRIGAVKVEAKDTTGAGDLYAAGFLYGLIKGKPLNEAGDIGAELAGRVVEVIGAALPREVLEAVRQET